MAEKFDPILRLEHDGETFDLLGLKALEMERVQGWTKLPNRREFYAAIRREDPKAIIAAFMLSRIRKGETPRWGDVDIDLDALVVSLVDDETGRKVDPVIDTLDDGRPRLVKFDRDRGFIRDDNGQLIPDPNGVPVQATDDDGNPLWSYSDNGEPVPPTEHPATATSAATTGQPGDGSASDSGTPPTALP